MRKILSLFAAMLFAFAANATVRNITPTHCFEGDRTDGYTLYVELARGAQAGDTIVMADGEYLEGQSIPVNVPVVIMAAEGAHPVVKMSGYFQVHASMKVEGVKFQFVGAETNGYCFYFYENSSKYLVLEGCEFQNFTQYVASSWEAYHIDSCIVNNCYFHDLAKAPFYFAKSTLPNDTNACDNLTVKNSTFANITLSQVAVLDLRNNNNSTAATSKLRVDHCTFYNCKGYERMIQSYKSPDVVVCNCIMMNPLAASEEADIYATYLYGGSVHHNLNYQTKRQYGSGVTVTDSICRDPQFTDAVNANYTLAATSPAIGAGSDGSTLGDPRWWPAAPQPASKEAVLQYTGDVTTNMAGNGANNATTLGLDADVFTVLADKGSNQNFPGLNKAHDIRLYPDKNSGNGNSIIVSIENGTIDSIALDIKQTATYVVKAGETAVTGVANVFAINGPSFSIQNTTTGATTQLQLNKITIYYTGGEAPAVAKPAIAGETSFFGETEVTITCDTEGAAIYYTLDGTEPTAASTQYTAAFKLNATATVKAIAILGDDASAVVEAQFTKNPSFASFEALIAAGVADKTLVEVSFADVLIDSIYVNSSSIRKGVYFTVGGKAYEIYYSNGDAAVPAEWVAGGKVSGTIRGQWTVYKGLWELVPTAPWTWEALTYATDEPVVDPWVEIVFTKAEAVGAFNDSIFTVEGSEFSLKCVDTENSKLKTTSNNASFGSLDERHDYSIRLQTSGKSSSKNNMELNIPADGKLRIAVRTATSSDLTRTLVLAQGTDTIYNEVLLDTDTVEGASSPKIFNFVYADVKAGKVSVTYPINAINFYAFAFKEDVQNVYTVVGDPRVFGVNWDPTAVANDMEKQEDGSYKWAKDSLTLAAGSYDYKIVKDHSWAGEWPVGEGNNKSFSLEANGLYNITITFNPAAEEAEKAAVVATKIADVKIIPTVAMHGDFTGKWEDTQLFTLAQDSASASLKLNLEAKTYEFGVRLNGGWTANSANLTRENPYTILSVGADNNMKVVADQAGEYTFTYFFEEDSFVVAYPELVPAEGPTAAPAEPTWPANQVKAVYSAKYEADCGFGEWGSGTVYTQEEFGKKYVTTGLGYFGLVFDGEGQHLNCSKMEKLHMDVWIAQDTTIRVVPIWTSEPGKEQGIFVRLEANKWNSVEIALADYDRITSWLDIYQIKIDEARNMTFWINNVYFYTTQAPEEDPEAPQNFTAELAETSFFSVRIKAHATDNSGIVKYNVINGELIVASATGASDQDTYITVKDLTPNTDYSFKVVAKDESGNSTEPIELAAVKTLAAPAAAHAPTMAAEKVVSLYSDAYTTATTYETLNQGWWMGPATMVEAELAENDHVLYYADFAEGGSFGWAFNTEVDAAGYQKLHLDIYPTEATSFIVWPVIQPEAEFKTTTEELVANQWNEVIIDLTDKTFAPFKQFGWVISKSIPGFFVDNVYFFNDAEGFENIDASVKAVKVLYNGQILILRGDKVYTVTGQPVK